MKGPGDAIMAKNVDADANLNVNDSTDVDPFGAHSDAAKEIINFIKAPFYDHLLLTGISGAGKTYLIKRIQNFLNDLCWSVISCPELFLADIGDTERHLAKIMSNADIAVLDMVEVIAGRLSSHVGREMEHRIQSVFKYLLDERKVKVIGITNVPELLETDFTRSGRFSTFINVSLSFAWQRKSLLKELNHFLNDDQLNLLAERALGYSAADLERLHSIAYQIAINAGRLFMSYDDYLLAMKEIQPSTTKGLPLIKSSAAGIPSLLVGLTHIEKEILVPIHYSDLGPTLILIRRTLSTLLTMDCYVVSR